MFFNCISIKSYVKTKKLASDKQMKVHSIVAMTKNYVIGNKGTIPWKIKEDMALFKEKTIGQTVIMGKNTWLSLPEKFRPLPNRNNIIVSTTLDEQTGAIICKTIEDAITEAKKFEKEIYCIGGGQIYGAMLPFIEVLDISWIKKEYEGETKFPKINFEEWICVEEKNFEEFNYKKYERKI